MRKLQLIIALTCMGWTVKAQDSLKAVQLDEVVVTGTKSEIPVEKSGKSIVKFTRNQIENSGANTVAEVLNQVPGVQMDGNFGAPGTNIGYFVRGASSKRTLVLIDGVPFNDASGIDQTYDLRLLDLDQVKSIEILKGGLSTLYGTGAAAGVINIQLRKPEEQQIGGYTKLEYGSFNTFNANTGLSGTIGKISYLANAGLKKSDGFSAAKDESGTGNFDDDGFEGYNFLGKLDYQFSSSFTLGFTTGFDQFENDFDTGAFTDSETNFSEYKQVRFGLRPSIKWTDGSLKGNLFVNNLDRMFDSFGTQTEYDAKNYQVDLVIDQNITDQIKLIGGINYQQLAYSQPDAEEQSFNMLDPYATLIYDKNDFNIQVGGRLNVHSDYGSNFVYNVNPSYIFDLDEVDVKVYGSYATAFITPSLFQLFGPFGANPDLKPEDSESAEIGTTSYFNGLQLDVVYFYRNDENLIIFTDRYQNSEERIETDGLELISTLKVSEKFSVSANYTYTRRLNDEVMYRIPAHKYGATVTLTPIKNLTTSINYLHTGDRPLRYFDNTTFTTQEVNGDSFDLVDLNTSYHWKDFTFSGAVRNLFDTDYQAIAGFNSVGRNYTAGIKYQFN
ncbi:TonB-dependent receptor plug domain-containing protein [Ekhidna sp.]|uniref:TonB-dependent receptor plug domain-containing protein n=1 Tax=Ekhidna sp. TaxID=2608089 RepID=UPI003CCC3353